MSEYFETARSEGVLRLARPETRWLSTGWDGGFCRAEAAYNCTVPKGWDPGDIRADVQDRLDRADFDAAAGPILLTGVDQRHASGARLGPVTVFATVGLSNPTTLPLEPDERRAEVGAVDGSDESPEPGTVNLVVGTTRSLTDAGMANLVAIAAEARTATLLELVGFTGTTSDAIVVASDPAGEPTQYTGSATPVGRATRACVRAAITASFRSRYEETDPPASVQAAEHGQATTARAEVFEP
ncbi:adenosylcobinamide amidohydrolase [Halorhabdus sp. CBA1104]|uniref:adenosylcobinamide amidohydrolase n=1 Tax=Halorhabdus sp. CBA1104 TaxID=1380432 RepID=UPI0012B3F4A2|nr:adenosylcobinamide amidohydrolase [Halorhabdus sp. CBA1104]QGN07286.1 adenosylcobinamide amidohydrolase [Halorhabdus sp. CBA1104]